VKPRGGGLAPNAFGYDAKPIAEGLNIPRQCRSYSTQPAQSPINSYRQALRSWWRSRPGPWRLA